MSKKLLLIGGGGHAHSVIDSIDSTDDFDEVGIVVNDLPIGAEICGIKVVGTDDTLEELRRQGFNYAFVTVGSTGNSSVRRKLTDLVSKYDYIIPNIIDPTATISRFSTIGSGNFIGKKAIVNANSVIGDNCIINTASIIEHDCVLGDFIHVSPGSVLNGGVHVGNDSHIGSNSSVKQTVNIGSNSLIGIGSVVLKDISNNVIAYGNPCREVKSK